MTFKTFQFSKIERRESEAESGITWVVLSRPSVCSVVRPLGLVAMERHPISLLWAGSGVLSCDWLSEASACLRRREKLLCVSVWESSFHPSLLPSFLPSILTSSEGKCPTVRPPSFPPSSRLFFPPSLLRVYMNCLLFDRWVKAQLWLTQQRPCGDVLELHAGRHGGRGSHEYFVLFLLLFVVLFILLLSHLLLLTLVIAVVVN